MKKMQLNALNVGGALSREQMKKVTGGGFHPCASQCLSDAECAGLSGHCVIAPDPNCHNRDGSIQNVGTCAA
jgi:hypothetical protein